MNGTFSEGLDKSVNVLIAKNNIDISDKYKASDVEHFRVTNIILQYNSMHLLIIYPLFLLNGSKNAGLIDKNLSQTSLPQV